MRPVTLSLPDAPALLGRAHQFTGRASVIFAKLDWILLPLLAFSVSRLMIFFVGIVGDVFLPTEEGHWIAVPDSNFLSMWTKWDSQWYVQIAREGYFFTPGKMSNVAFFPLYPIAMRVAARLLSIDVIPAGFLVSNACFFLALVFLYRLTVLELNDRSSAQRTIFYLAFFPTAFFFSAVYTESLFLLLTVATMYFARSKHWLMAALCGLLASATRNLGVLMWGLVMWEWLRANGWQITNMHRRASWLSLWNGIREHWDQLFIIAIIPLGMLLYMWFLRNNFGSPFAFIEVQAAWNRENIGPIAVLIRDVGLLLDVQVKQWYFLLLLNTTVALSALAMTPFIWRQIGEGYALYVLILMAVPLASSTGSVARYVLPLFPIFIMLGWWGRRAGVNHTLLSTFAILLGLLTTIFVNWLFVA